MADTLFVAGDWGEDHRPSGYMKKLKKAMGCDMKFHNGGTFEQLRILAECANQYKVIYWFPNVSNKREKLLPRIKQINPRCILIASKSNPQGKYSPMSLIARALQVKANLILELTGTPQAIAGTVMDPLGNCFASQETSIEVLAYNLCARVAALREFTRVGSTRVGEGLEPHADADGDVANMLVFFQHVKKYADVFHELIHAMFQDRFLGNVSFRCERGFPSFRGESGIWVSQRNMDKRFIGPESFVLVESQLKDGRVAYYGDHKPSVDTPIHLELYRRFPKINFMLHSHTYIEHAVFTKKVIPCGATEEIEEIATILKNHQPFREIGTAYINLMGHGSVVIGNKPLAFNDIPYVSRVIPEMYDPEGSEIDSDASEDERVSEARGRVCDAAERFTKLLAANERGMGTWHVMCEEAYQNLCDAVFAAREAELRGELEDQEAGKPTVHQQS